MMQTIVHQEHEDDDKIASSDEAIQPGRVWMAKTAIGNMTVIAMGRSSQKGDLG